MIHDAETPLAEFSDIIDNDVPLSEYDDFEELIIEEPDVPLAEMPATGLASIVDFLTTGFMLSALIIAIIARLLRRPLKEEADDEDSKTGDGSVS